MIDVVLFGTGLAAQTVAFHLARHGGYRILGHTVDAAWRRTDTQDGLPVVDWETLEQHFPPDRVQLFGPFSYARMNTLRRDRYLEGKARGYRFASFIHPSSHVFAEHIGENCLVLEACAIQPFTRIGDNVIVWCLTAVGHHVVLEDHCFLSGHIAIGGGTRIGAESYLSAQVSVGHGLSIGRGCALLNGAMVSRSLPDHSVVTGPGGTLKPYPSTRLHRLI